MSIYIVRDQGLLHLIIDPESSSMIHQRTSNLTGQLGMTVRHSGWMACRMLPSSKPLWTDPPPGDEAPTRHLTFYSLKWPYSYCLYEDGADWICRASNGRRRCDNRGPAWHSDPPRPYVMPCDFFLIRPHKLCSLGTSRFIPPFPSRLCHLRWNNRWSN